jgi:hypothetical protein
MAIGAHHVRPRTGGVWRQLTSAAVAYALVVQAFAFGLLGGQLTATTATGQSSPAFEICLHDSTTSSPLSPVPLQGDRIHCVFCIAGSHHAFTAPTVPSAGIVVAVGRMALELTGDWHLPALSNHRDAQPRGPPITA